jgi:hypothetical protein
MNILVIIVLINHLARKIISEDNEEDGVGVKRVRKTMR